MPLSKEHNYTIDDIYALPDGQRAELIDGQIYNSTCPTRSVSIMGRCDLPPNEHEGAFPSTPPGRIHQKIVQQLSRILGNYIADRGGDCEVYPAPFAVFLLNDSKNYVEPDISVICDKDRLSDRGCEGAPDFVVEVVSPGSRRMDYAAKNSLYSNAGVREYWIVDPQKGRTTVYRYEEDAAPMIVPFEQPVTVGIYGDLEVTIADYL